MELFASNPYLRETSHIFELAWCDRSELGVDLVSILSNYFLHDESNDRPRQQARRPRRPDTTRRAIVELLVRQPHRASDLADAMNDMRRWLDQLQQQWDAQLQSFKEHVERQAE
jgi:hypothetical protein